jgi:hypothetical protein
VVFEDFADEMEDVKNGLLGVKRNTFLKLISFFDYKDQNKLRQV